MEDGPSIALLGLEADDIPLDATTHELQRSRLVEDLCGANSSNSKPPGSFVVLPVAVIKIIVSRLDERSLECLRKTHVAFHRLVRSHRHRRRCDVYAPLLRRKLSHSDFYPTMCRMNKGDPRQHWTMSAHFMETCGPELAILSVGTMLKSLHSNCVELALLALRHFQWVSLIWPDTSGQLIDWLFKPDLERHLFALGQDHRAYLNAHARVFEDFYIARLGSLADLDDEQLGTSSIAMLRLWSKRLWSKDVLTRVWRHLIAVLKREVDVSLWRDTNRTIVLLHWLAPYISDSSAVEIVEILCNQMERDKRNDPHKRRRAIAVSALVEMDKLFPSLPVEIPNLKELVQSVLQVRANIDSDSECGSLSLS
jgi:hypothetical protein